MRTVAIDGDGNVVAGGWGDEYTEDDYRVFLVLARRAEAVQLRLDAQRPRVTSGPEGPQTCGADAKGQTTRLTNCKKMAQLDDRLAAPRDDGATRIVSLHEGDSLPRGARFCQIVGSKLDGGSRRVYLVLVEQASSEGHISDDMPPA